MRILGMALFGFFCITSGARANPVVTCTVYDSTGVSAIGACSDFGSTLDRLGRSQSAHVFGGRYGYFWIHGHIFLLNNLPPNEIDGSEPPGPRYRAEVVVSNHVSGVEYFVIRGGTGLAHLSIIPFISPGDVDTGGFPDGGSESISVNYAFPDFDSSSVYPYNKPFRVTYDLSLYMATGKQRPAHYVSWHEERGIELRVLFPEETSFDPHRSSYIEAVPEPSAFLPLLGIGLLLIARRRR